MEMERRSINGNQTAEAREMIHIKKERLEKVILMLNGNRLKSQYQKNSLLQCQPKPAITLEKHREEDADSAEAHERVLNCQFR